jgi:hypothetical protein
VSNNNWPASSIGVLSRLRPAAAIGNQDGVNANETQDPGETDRIIADELRHLLESPMFTRSPVLSRLLQFLVDHRLRGGRSAPKAYAIATEALGRSADFDPAVDSYPRVMVGRLRSLLDRYYAETPWVHRLRVPQGSYEVVVQHRSAPPARAVEGADADGPPLGADAALEESGGKAARAPLGLMARPGVRRAPWVWAAALLLLCAALLAGWKLLGDSRRLFDGGPVPPPVLEISAPQAGDSRSARATARALDGKLRDGIRRFELVDLRSAKRPGVVEPESPVDYRLDSLIVQTDEGPVELTLVLNRIADQRAIWSQQYRIEHSDVPEFAAIEPAIAQIAGDYGLIVRDLLRREPDNFAAGFPCLAQFQRTRQMRPEGDARRVETCLRATLKEDPLDPVVLSALSLLRFGDWQRRRDAPEGGQALVEARTLAEQAYQNSPGATAGLIAMARAHIFMGNCAGGNAMGEAAVRLNPYDADMTGFLGLFKLACGADEQGEALLRRSLALDPSYPGIPGVTLAFLVSERGAQDEALAILDQMPSPSNMEPQYMMVRAIVRARQGALVEARQIWRQLLAYAGQPATAQPERVLSQFMITPILIQRASDALRESGVAAPAGARTGPEGRP